jgi:hypothetical protein
MSITNVYSISDVKRLCVEHAVKGEKIQVQKRVKSDPAAHYKLGGWEDVYMDEWGLLPVSIDALRIINRGVMVEAEYRIILVDSRIGSNTFPTAISTPPRVGDRVYVLDLTNIYLYATFLWVATQSQLVLFERRILHYTQQAAICHARALLAVAGGE